MVSVVSLITFLTPLSGDNADGVSSYDGAPSHENAQYDECAYHVRDMLCDDVHDARDMYGALYGGARDAHGAPHGDVNDGVHADGAPNADAHDGADGDAPHGDGYDDAGAYAPACVSAYAPGGASDGVDGDADACEIADADDANGVNDGGSYSDDAHDGVRESPGGGDAHHDDVSPSLRSLDPLDRVI